jgi:hypothetical protein
MPKQPEADGNGFETSSELRRDVPTASPVLPPSALIRLRKLAELEEPGLITNGEFEKLKAT